MLPPIELLHLRAYEGPNIHGPAPGVLLRLRCDRDRSARLRAALKDGAQFIGMVLAYLETTARADSAGVLVTASFTSDAPQFGAALARYVAAGMAAEAAADDEWDRDGPLLALRERRAAETLPVAALRLVAEARRRGLPVLRLPDGTLRLGYGANGYPLVPTSLEETSAPAVPWEQLGAVPIVAVTGGSGRAAAVQQLAAALLERYPTTALDNAGFEATRAALANPATAALVVGLDATDVMQRGLAFERCTLAVVTDRDGVRPAAALNDEEWLQALGLPMLVSEQPARLNLADPRLRPLLPYAPHGVLGL